MKRGQLKERINYYIRNGVTDANIIIEKLQREFPEETIKSNSVKSYISILKTPKENQSTEFENNNSNADINGNNLSSNRSNDDNFSNNSNDLSNNPNNESIQTKEETFETQESQKEITIKNISDVQTKAPVNLITANTHFDLTASEHAVLPEASSIAQSYQEQKIDETIDPEQEKKTQIHIDRFGEIAGDMSLIVFNSKAFQKFSHGYKIEDKEVKRINEDMGIVLKQRVPSVFSEYGDLVNLAGDMGRVFMKGLAHRLKSPLPKDLEEKIKESEKNIEQVVEQVVEQIKETPEVSIESQNKINEKACKRCNNESVQDLDINGHCPNCHFEYTIEQLEKQNK